MANYGAGDVAKSSAGSGGKLSKVSLCRLHAHKFMLSQCNHSQLTILVPGGSRCNSRQLCSWQFDEAGLWQAGSSVGAPMKQNYKKIHHNKNKKKNNPAQAARAQGGAAAGGYGGGDGQPARAVQRRQRQGGGGGRAGRATARGYPRRSAARRR